VVTTLLLEVQRMGRPVSSSLAVAAALAAALAMVAGIVACGSGSSGKGPGSVAWTVMVNTTDHDTVYGVAAAPNGSAFAAGYTSGDLHGNTVLGSKDGFLVKYNPAGARQWTVMINTTGGDTAFGAAADPDGNALVAGETQGDLHGHTNLGSNDAFLAKYDTAGARLWTEMINTSGFDTAYAAASDADGNVFVGGYSNGDLDGHLNVGPYDGFVAMYNSSGQWQWTEMINTTGFDFVEGLGVDLNGNVIVAGSSDRDLHGHTNMGSKDAFVAVYSSGGVRQWTAMMNTDRTATCTAT
jgi:hypothetical protein